MRNPARCHNHACSLPPYGEERLGRVSNHEGTQVDRGRPILRDDGFAVPQDEAVPACGPAACVSRGPYRFHDVKQRSVLRSRGALLRPGLACFLSHPLRRDFAHHPPSPSFGAQASRPLSASATRDSRTPDEGWMERRQTHSFFRSRLRRATTLSRGDRDLSRRSTVAVFGCGPTKPAPGSGTGARSDCPRQA
jgi:hypothetical protein